MKSIFVFTQNLRLESLKALVSLKTDDNIFLTTHYLFDNEKRYIESLFDNCIFKTFADYLTDEEMSQCDKQAYKKGISKENYVRELNSLKNKVVVNKVENIFNSNNKFVLCNDLGITINDWINSGFVFLKCEYYHELESTQKRTFRSFLSNILFLKKIYHFLVFFKKNKRKTTHNYEDVWVSYYNNHKYVFLGSLNRIGYRFNVEFSHSKEEYEKINRGIFDSSKICTYLTTWHEQGHCNIPDLKKYDVRWCQDGYLPPNYSHFDYFFKPHNVKYYCWDKLGTLLFEKMNLPYELIPFRKKLFLPMPVFPTAIKKILIVASGSGDWTALKNRSDDDLLVNAFAEMARRFPEIQFTYRCHPTWTHPKHVGVNSINRVAEYFASTGLSNIMISSNIPCALENDKYCLSFSRSSLESDLESADFVFGEHSISMIDGAFKGIPFSSVNLTKRRNFFVGITDLGFPHCSSIDEIEKVIRNALTAEFQSKYLEAIFNYNKMTNDE